MRTHEGRQRRVNTHVPLVNRPGVIAVVSGDRTTCPQFAGNVACLQTTRGSSLLWQLAGGGGVAEARNRLVERALKAGADWVWFIDDDHVFPSNVLGSLLRADKDICVPAVLQRLPPHELVAWDYFDVSPDATDEELVAEVEAHPDRATIPAGASGPMEIGLGGTGGMLIASEVLQAMPPPWFEFGRFGTDDAGEDTFFCL